MPDDASPDAASDASSSEWALRTLDEGAPRFGVAPRPAIAAGVLALLGLIVCAWLALRPAPQGEILAPRANPIPAVTHSASASTGVLTSAPAAPPALPSAAVTDAAVGAPAGALSVYVVGQVRSPGVFSLASGARVVDAIAAAGGATDKADLAAVNLARKVSDGEQILIPLPGQSVPLVPEAAGAGAGAGVGAEGRSDAPLNLNTATQDQLDELPGVGPVIAGRIVAWRTENGQFTSVSQLRDVSGIGDATLAKLRPLVTV